MSNIDPSTREEFEIYYRQVLDESGAAAPDQELLVVRRLLQAAQEGSMPPTADGLQHKVGRDASIDWSRDAAIEAAMDADGIAPRRFSPQAMVFLAIFIVGCIYLLWQDWSDTKDVPVEATTIVLEPTATFVPLTMEDIVSSIDVRVPLYTPTTLEISGVFFVVQPVEIESGGWKLPESERAASWVYGTVINYVIGLRAENTPLLESLVGEEELILRLSTGGMLHFRFRDSLTVEQGQTEVFRQFTPGLTLVLLDTEGEKRTIFRATYLDDRELRTSGRAALPIQIGETADLGGLHLTATGIRREGQVVTISFTAHPAAGDLVCTLHSGRQVVYPLPNGPRGEAAYLLTSEPQGAVLWRCRFGEAETALPITLAAPPGVLPVMVGVQGNLHGRELYLTVTVQNDGQTALEMDGRDVTARTLAGPATIQAFWPWTIPAHSEREFPLLVTGIEETAAILELVILERHFQLQW